jgi:phosphoserine aminotransferase
VNAALTGAVAMSTSAVSRVFNFSAGPAVLPVPVLEQVRDELLSLPGVGSSVLEISHRSKDFDNILDDANEQIRRLANVPESHEILYLQGGAALQNVMIPMNLLTAPDQTADYIVTGSWGKKSSAEAHRFGNMNVAWSGADQNFNRIPSNDELQLTPDAAYVHLTSNETIQGVQFKELPNTSGVPIVADKSSDVFSEPINISDYGLIYACAQKNAGIAGVTVVILDKELLARSDSRLPSYLDYSKHSAGGSRFNTPPTFAIYVTGLVCRWLQEEMGGLEKVAEFNRDKANLLYDIIDENKDFYFGHAEPEFRSTMNVVFKTTSPEMDAQFLEQAKQEGMTTLKGHRSVGGIRASIYNAMPLEGVQALAGFMKDFAEKHG